ncbi:TonB-dependent receptor plug domain-containing protein [Erythrobacter sp. 3-20A1M]|uniref:TonB-dependent receptor n=1 Tax=Erythrobacter sp. 3-20A1M TaxID=2653850 RepID=UPI001BFC750D|nr:TonB-dependent receptor [Erythrobacter sp. 3-20A1M]QWC57673.1 TonB-dependent receptor plug domain-containing protein [Erythrobacter sp. 3-20A1M]
MSIRHTVATLARTTALGASLCGIVGAAPVLAQAGAGPDSNEQATNVIVVTATKRTEPLADIPASVSAVTSEELQDLNAQSLSDYITRIPGVVFNDYQPGVSEVVIRGIASTTYHEANQATTGYYLNQIPLVEPGFPIAIPDVDTFDLSQVEVLRGPQGTLFGSSSLGGAVNYVTNEAKADAIDAGFEGLIGSTRRAGEANYAVKGMVNIPVVKDKLAVRLVALQRFDAGYLDNTGTGVDGSNDLRVRGVRGSIVFTPTETTKITELSMFQEYNLDDQTYVEFGADPNEPTYTRNTNVPEYQDTQFQLHSLRLEQELGGFADLTAIGSYIRKENDLAFDDSIFVGIDARTGTPQLSASVGKSETYYGELRLASSGTGPFTWLIGANYTKLNADSTDRVFIEGIGDYIDANPGEFDNQPASTIAPGDFVQRTQSTSDVREIALFGEASYTFLDTLTLTLGGRAFEYRSDPRLQFLPNANLIPAFDYQPGEQKESGFIPKASLRWKPSDRFMVYGLYSEGFRLGGINVYSVASGAPLNFDSDSTRNFEIGTRFRPVEGMSFDITAYHIDWDDIQVRLFAPPDFNAYTTNGGGAHIDGVEFQLAFQPARFMSLTSSVSYNDARLSELLPDSFAPGGGYAAGSRLPGAAEWTIANQLEFSLPDSPRNPRLGIAHRYLSDAPVAFGAALQKGDYHIVDLNASIEVADGLELGVFVKNLFDEYAILNAPFSFAGSVTRPRTIGATLRFDLN